MQSGLSTKPTTVGTTYPCCEHNHARKAQEKRESHRERQAPAKVVAQKTLLAG